MTNMSHVASLSSVISEQTNQSVWSSTPFPSGYSVTHITVIALLVIFLIVLIIGGNLLVIIAIARARALRGTQHWFIASLAVADFLVGLIIMPFSLARELMGYWAFGELWCQLHAAIDVLACTSSINNICLISLDRYWSVTRASNYLKHRDPWRATLLIAFVWLLSAAISIPPLLGWRQVPPPSEHPECELSQDIGYVLFSALGSFYLPSFIMLFVYVRIYIAARNRTRRHLRRKKLDFTISTIALAEMPHALPSMGDCESHKSIGHVEMTPRSKRIRLRAFSSRKHVDSPRLFIEQPSTADAAETNGSGGNAAEATAEDHSPTLLELASLRRDCSTDTEPPLTPATGATTSTSQNGSEHGSRSMWRPGFYSGSVFRWNRQLSAAGSTDEPDPPLHPSGSRSSEMHRQSRPDSVPSAKARRVLGADPARERRRVARKKEKRATLILGLIMGSFIACWLPFFVLYVLTPICTDCPVSHWMFATTFWLGYVNSAINPVIYTIFNKDYRQAFRKLLSRRR